MPHAIRKSLPFFLLLLIPLGCKTGNSANPPAGPDFSSNATRRFILDGGVPSPGPRALQPGQTVAMVIQENFIHTGRPATVVLVRLGPEGKTRELIEVDPSGKLMDEKQDYLLRDGDELVFPGPTMGDEPGK